MSAARLQNTPEAGPNAFPVRPYQPSSSQWPYNDAKDFSRHDENDDNIFYLEPRFVEHIDEAAIDRLTRYYQSVLPSTGRVLDLCTSWKSFYPGACEDAVRNEKLDVYGIGLNKEEMVANPLLCDFPERRIQLNLNQEPQDIKAAWSDREPPKFDTVTCVVSIDYISRPLQVLRSIRERTNDGGSIHLVVSNRCFPTKVVKLWLEYDEQQRLQLVGDYLHFSGWKDVEIVDLCARDADGKRITDDHGTFLSGMKVLGYTISAQHLDPLWVVRGTKRE